MHEHLTKSNNVPASTNFSFSKAMHSLFVLLTSFQTSPLDVSMQTDEIITLCMKYFQTPIFLRCNISNFRSNNNKGFRT